MTKNALISPQVLMPYDLLLPLLLATDASKTELGDILSAEQRTETFNRLCKPYNECHRAALPADR